MKYMYLVDSSFYEENVNELTEHSDKLNYDEPG